MENKEIRPHCAIIQVNIEVHSLLDSGEFSGHILNDHKLQEHDLIPHRFFSIYGKNAEECLHKLKIIMEQLKKAVAKNE